MLASLHEAYMRYGVRQASMPSDVCIVLEGYRAECCSYDWMLWKTLSLS